MSLKLADLNVYELDAKQLEALFEQDWKDAVKEIDPAMEAKVLSLDRAGLEPDADALTAEFSDRMGAELEWIKTERGMEATERVRGIVWSDAASDALIAEMKAWIKRHNKCHDPERSGIAASITFNDSGRLLVYRFAEAIAAAHKQFRKELIEGLEEGDEEVITPFRATKVIFPYTRTALAAFDVPRESDEIHIDRFDSEGFTEVRDLAAKLVESEEEDAYAGTDDI